MELKKLWWLAAMLEGEGSFMPKTGGTVRVQFASTDLDIANRVHRLMGGTVRAEQPTGLSKKILYRVVVSGFKARRLMRRVWPIMGYRRRARIDDCLARPEARRLSARRIAAIRRHPGPLRVIAKKFGVSFSNASVWRRDPARTYKRNV